MMDVEVGGLYTTGTFSKTNVLPITLVNTQEAIAQPQNDLKLLART